NSSTDTTPSDFQIQPPPIDTQAPMVTIFRPMGDTIPTGQPISVNWKSTDNVAVVSQSLLVSFDNGATFQTAASFGAESSSFTLSNIAGLEKTTARGLVKIRAEDGAGNIGEQSGGFTLTPAIMQVGYTKPVLTISGIGFQSNNAQATVRVLINGMETAASMTTLGSNSEIRVKGNKKKLRLVKGTNSVQVIVDGVMSNAASFQF